MNVVVFAMFLIFLKCNVFFFQNFEREYCMSWQYCHIYINLYSSIVSEIIYIYPKKIEISFCFKVSNIIREFKVDSMYYIIIIVGLNDWKRSKDKHTWKWIKCAVWKLHDRTKWQETMRTKLVMDCIESHSCVLKIQFFSQQQWNFDLKKKKKKTSCFI